LHGHEPEPGPEPEPPDPGAAPPDPAPAPDPAPGFVGDVGPAGLVGLLGLVGLVGFVDVGRPGRASVGGRSVKELRSSSEAFAESSPKSLKYAKRLTTASVTALRGKACFAISRKTGESEIAFTSLVSL